MAIGDFIRNSQVWKSIFRHPAPYDRRNRVVVMLTNFFLHLHPVSVKQEGIEIRTASGRRLVSTPEHVHFAGEVGGVDEVEATGGSAP